jgi:hypothetical protein
MIQRTKEDDLTREFSENPEKRVGIDLRSML